jgi:hypothetical protein
MLAEIRFQNKPIDTSSQLCAGNLLQPYIKQTAAMAVEMEPKVQSLGEAEQQHTPDNAEILRKTWSRKAVTIAFSG